MRGTTRNAYEDRMREGLRSSRDPNIVAVGQGCSTISTKTVVRQAQELQQRLTRSLLRIERQTVRGRNTPRFRPHSEQDLQSPGRGGKEIMQVEQERRQLWGQDEGRGRVELKFGVGARSCHSLISWWDSFGLVKNKFQFYFPLTGPQRRRNLRTGGTSDRRQG